MLPKNRRIQRKDFSFILKNGKRYNSPHLLVYVVKLNYSDTSTKSRFSFSVSKKVSKKAVDRNRLRRRGYSIIAKHKNILEKSLFCFFSFKKGAGTLTFTQLKKEIIDLLRDATVLL